jgi:hypothetical protein
MQKQQRTKLIVIIVVTLIALNLLTFIVAYPETYTPSPGISVGGDILAKDFSAYYIAAYRLWNNPSNIYTFGAQGGAEPQTPPHPEAYKYLPNFLLVVSPFLLLSYQQALLAFDIVQFLLLPLMALIIYRLLEDKNIAVIFAVMTIALLLPFPTLQWGASVSYYWQWGEGQAKVFATFLLLLSFYFGKQNKPLLSGVAFAFGAFDPRFGLLAIPLFVLYNRNHLKIAGAAAVFALAASNLMLLYPGMGAGFLGMVFGSGITTPVYYYALIPLLTLMSFIVVNFKQVVAAFDYRGVFAEFTGVQDKQE